MKKVLCLIILAVIALTAHAQSDSVRVIPMNRTFSVGGKALLCLRSANAAKRDLKALTWTLENKVIGDKNFITLKVINAKTEHMEAHQTWSDNEKIEMRINKEGEKSYIVYDDTFRHLLMTDIGKEVYVILLYSDLLDSPKEVDFEK